MHVHRPVPSDPNAVHAYARAAQQALGLAGSGDRSADSLDAHADGIESAEAARRAMERSRAWHEHVLAHQQEGTSAKLVVTEEPRVAPAGLAVNQPAFVEESPIRARAEPHLVGYCTCQSPVLRLLFGDKGVENAPLVPIVTNEYGVAQDGPVTYAGGATVTYGGSAGGSESLYAGRAATESSVYRRDGPSENPLYR
jgi:hypothetical protein